MKHFGRNVEILRDKLGLTNKDIAIGIKKSEATLSRWINGGSGPELSNLDSLADFFKVPSHFLLMNPDEMANMIDLSGLSDDQVNAINLIVAGLKGKQNG